MITFSFRGRETKGVAMSASLDGPHWTQEQAVAFESARECITDLAGIYTGLIADERQKAFPDAHVIASLRAKRSALVSERAGLHVQDAEHVAQIRRDYGARIQAFRAAHSQRQAA
jgi:hypothetical protein